MHAQIDNLVKNLKEFDIVFIGLKEGPHQFEYNIKKEFFDFFNFDEIFDSNVTVKISFLKKTTIFELNFEFSGWVEVACDVSNEHYQQTVSATTELIVKFGEEYNDENEELLIIPHTEYQINLGQYLYESIVLAIPLKKVHPGVLNGTLHTKTLEKLKEFELSNEINELDEEEQKEDKENDPRWNKLKDLQ